MSDEGVPESGRITRRRVLQAVGASSTLGLAGCLHERPCDLTISKEHSGSPVNYGGTTDFQITVCNDGDQECTGSVTVSDNLPSGTSFDSVSGSGWTASQSGGTVTLTHPNSNGLGGGDCLPTATLTIQVGQPSAVGPEIANCATVGQDDQKNNTDCVKVPVEPLDGECDLSISKTYDGDAITANSQATFQIEVCNVGDGVCDEPVTVVDGLPSGLTFGSASGTGWSVSQSGGSVVATHTNANGLTAGQCLPVLELTVNVGPISVTGDQVRNCAAIKGEDVNPENDRNCVTVPVLTDDPMGECDLSISKTYDGDVITANSQATFQIEVCNVGDGVCDEPVTVVDGLPSGTSFDSGSGSGWSVSQSGGSIVATHDNTSGLTAGQCLPVLELTLDIGSMDEVGDQIRNCVTLKGEDVNPENDRDCVSVPVVSDNSDGRCDLSISKTYDGDVITANSQATFQIEVCNVGDGVCPEPVTVVDGLPGGTSFDSASGSGWSVSQSGGSVVATHTNTNGLSPGQCLPILELTLDIGSMDETGDQIRNCANLEGEDVNPENDRDCVSVPVVPDSGECDLEVTKTHTGDGVATAGEPTSFEIVVCNVGDGDCDEPVTATDALPDGVTFTSASGPGWSVSHSGGVVTATHANSNGLAPGACLPALTLEVDVGSMDVVGDQIRNCVSIDSGDANQANDRDCAVVTVTQPADGCNGLEIEKVTASQFNYGQQEAYEITVCNPTDAPCASPITVTDTLPDGISFVSASGSGWSVSVSGGVVTATHANSGTLAPGNCLPTLTLTVDVAAAAVFPGGSDAVRNCADLIVDGAVVDQACVTHVIFN